LCEASDSGMNATGMLFRREWLELAALRGALFVHAACRSAGAIGAARAEVSGASRPARFANRAGLAIGIARFVLVGT